MAGFGNNFPTAPVTGDGNATKLQGMPVPAPTVAGSVLEYTALGLEWTSSPAPGPHAPTHGVGGSDPVSLDMSQVPTGQLDATRVGGGAVSNTEYSYLDGVTSAIQTQLNGKLATNGSAASLTSIPAGQLTGSIADARLSANVDLLNAAQTFTARKTFPSAGANAAQIPAILGGASNTSGHVVPNVADDTFALLAASQTLTNKSISGSSNTLTNIPAANLTGSVADARLSANVDLLNTAQTFTARKTFPSAGANAAQIPAILGGATNTNGHVVPNVVDDTFALLAASQTLSNKTLASPALSGTSSGTYSLGGTPSLGAALNANGFKVTNLGAPASSTDAARMDYVVSTVCMATATDPTVTGFWFFGMTGPMTQDPTIVVPFIVPYNATIDGMYWQSNNAAPAACKVDLRKSANTTPPYLYNLAVRLTVAMGDTRGNSGVGLSVSAGDTFIIAYGDFGVQWTHGGMTVSFSLRRS